VSEDYSPESGHRAAMNLDELEREGGPTQPFDFVLEGKRYLLADPQDLDWQDIISAMSNPVMFFRLVLPPEDHATFFKARIAGWKMNALMRGYQDHYGLPSQGEAGALPR
jgi:hypothetical protein